MDLDVRRLFLCVLTMGCSKKASDQDAIRASIDKHLNEAEGLNLSAMDREVKQITVDGDHASAQVEFRLKQGDARMEIEYTLDRQGKEWDVVKSAPVAGEFAHGRDGRSRRTLLQGGGSPSCWSLVRRN